MPTRDLKLSGVALMVAVALCTLAGVGIGALLGSSMAGGFLGAIAGVPVSTYIVWRLLIKPFSDEFSARDYSHLTAKVDDDD